MQYLYEQVTHLTQRGHFVQLPQLRGMLPCESDLYRSYYGYHPSIIEHLNEGGSITDFQGPFCVYELIADFDGHSGDLGRALGDVTEAVNKLTMGLDVDHDNILVWFSGGGFHITLPASLFGDAFAPSKDLPRLVRNTMLELFPKADTIYDKARLIRVGNSFNSKRGKWKVPLPMDMVLAGDIDGILDLAKGPVLTTNGYTPEAEPVLAGQVVATPENLEPTERTRVHLPDTNLTNVVTCMHSLYLRGPVDKRRHNDLLRLVSHWRRQHIPYEVCLDMAYTWLGNSRMDEGEVESIVRDVFDKDYRYSCSDVVRQEFCNKKCVFYAQQNEGSEVSNIDEMNDQMMETVLQLRDVKPFNLADHYSLREEYKVYPGELITLIGDTGVNKTALMQNIAMMMAPRKVLYASTEMSVKLLFRRFIQMASDMTKDEVMGYYEKGHMPPGIARLQHLQMTDEKLDTQKLYKHVLERKPEVVIVDVIEDIGDNPDPNKRIDQAAIGLSWLARNLGIIVINISHVRKAASGMPLDIDSSKGPKSLVQKSDKVWALEGNRNDPAGLRKLRTLKSRDESPFRIQLKLNRETFNLIQTYEPEQS